MGAHHTFQQMLQINGRSLDWPKMYFLCSRCDAGVGHASKPKSIPLAAGVSLQGYRLGGWSYSPAQLCRHLLMGRAGGQRQPQPTFTVCNRGVHWSLSDRYLLTLHSPFAFGLCQNQTNCCRQVVIQKECVRSRGKHFGN